MTQAFVCYRAMHHRLLVPHAAPFPSGRRFVYRQLVIDRRYAAPGRIVRQRTPVKPRLGQRVRDWLAARLHALAAAPAVHPATS